MKIKSMCLAILVLTSINLTTPASGAEAVPEVVLHLSLIDHYAFGPGDVWVRTRQLKKAYPRARVIRVDVETPRPSAPFSEWAEVNARVRSALLNLDLGTAKIKVMVIASHGNGGYIFSHLSGLGGFLASGPGPVLRQTLEPIRSSFAEDARVVLLGCATLAGERAQAYKRVESLMMHLGAVNGRAFGFLKNAYGHHRWNRSLPDRERIGVIVGLASVASLSALTIDPTYVLPLLAASAILYYVEFFLVDLLDKRARFFRSLDHPEINRGLLLTLKDGKIREEVELTYGRDDAIIYGCEKDLGAGAELLSLGYAYP